jgi:hypothetical protein
MKYIVFPSFESKEKSRPDLYHLIDDLDIDVMSGPTESGLYLIEGDPSTIEIFKYVVFPNYLIMEDFDPPIIH